MQPVEWNEAGGLRGWFYTPGLHSRKKVVAIKRNHLVCTSLKKLRAQK